MVSKPTFDPNTHLRATASATAVAPAPQRQAETAQQPNDQGRYPPNSTFKIVTRPPPSGGARSRRSRFITAAAFRSPNRVFRCCWKKGDHGTVDLPRDRRVVCDVYFLLGSAASSSASTPSRTTRTATTSARHHRRRARPRSRADPVGSVEARASAGGSRAERCRVDRTGLRAGDAAADGRRHRDGRGGTRYRPLRQAASTTRWARS